MANIRNKTPRSKYRAHISTDDDLAEDGTFVQKVQDMFAKDYNADMHNIEPAHEDLKFTIGDQWDAQVRAARERNNKPTLTVNRIPAFVAQYLGSWLQSDTSIKLTPTRGGTKAAAEVRQGIIRSIMRGVQGKYALNQAMSLSYIGGVGNFAISVCDNDDDVFAKDIQLDAIEDPFDVIWDRMSREPTGADAQHCYVFYPMARDDFDEAYPGNENDPGWEPSDMVESNMNSYGQMAEDVVRVCHFWQMRREAVTLGLEAETGDIIDVTDMSDQERFAKCEMDPDTLKPIIRETMHRYAECYVMTQTKVLDGPYRLDVPRLPVFRVPGWVIWVDGVPHRWGFVRNAKDPQRLHNYWRSILAQELAKSVSSKWLLDQAAMKSGLADKFRNAHLSDDNVLQWDSEAGGAKPEMIPPPPLNQAVLTEAQMTVQDIKDVTNKHEASLGLTSNEVSGKAITARQRVSELGDVIYIEHMNMALAEAGRVINHLIPFVYDTRRVVKIMGEDDKEQLQVINDEFGDKTPDVTKGKYDITYTSGPSYSTKRQEAVDVMMTLMNTMPQVGNIIADIIVRNMDIPGAEEIEDRLAAMLPDGMIDLDKLAPTRRAKVEQRQQIQQQQAQEAQQKQDMMLMVGLEKTKAEITELMARAKKQGAQAVAEQARVGIEKVNAFIDFLNVRVDAAKINAQGELKQAEVVMKGLDAAQSNRQRIEDRQAAVDDRDTQMAADKEAEDEDETEAGSE